MDGQRLVRPSLRGVAAALLGGLVGTVLMRALMRAVMVVADGTPSFTWSGLASIALFYITSLVPGAVALAWSAARWPLFVFGVGAIAIPVQAAGIAQTDLEAVGPFDLGQGVALSALFVAMAAIYALQAASVYRVARSGGRDRQGGSARGGADAREAREAPGRAWQRPGRRAR
jgi:hypothetical protein